MNKDLVALVKTETETETEVAWLGFPRMSLCELHTQLAGKALWGEGQRYVQPVVPSWSTVVQPAGPHGHQCSCQTLACALTAGTGTRGPSLPYFLRTSCPWIKPSTW